jgi:hypothetical protein
MTGDPSSDRPAEDDQPAQISDGERQQANDPTEISDLVGAELTLALIGWLVLTLACFFLIGPVVGLIVLVVGVVGFGWWAVSALRRADTSD